MSEEKESKSVRKKFLITVAVVLVIFIVAISLMLIPPPEPDPLYSTTMGKAMEQYLNDYSAFGDYLTAIRLTPQTKAWDTKLEDEVISFYDELHEFRTNDEITEASDKVRDYLGKCQPALDLVRIGIRKDDCVVPEIKGFNDLLPYLAGSRNLARILIADGKLKELNGDYRGAYENYLDAIRFGNDIANGGVLINGLVNLAINGMALESMRKNLDKVDASTLEMVVNVLGEEEKNMVSVSEVMKIETKLEVKAVEFAASNRGAASGLLGALGSGRKLRTAKGASFSDALWSMIPESALHNAGWLYIVLNKNRIVRNLEAHQKRFLELVEEGTASREAEEELEAFYTHDLVSATILPALCKVNSSYVRCSIYMNGTRLRAAVELYQRRHGELPESLDQLVSDGIVEEIPIDPYSKKLFKYSDNKIYSVGPDLDDGQGSVSMTARDILVLKPGDIVF